MTTLIIIILLIAINAFFVAAEFALVKARPTRIIQFAKDKHFGASIAQKIQANLEEHLAACQLGITMASLGLGWVGEPFVAALLSPVLLSMGLSEQAIHSTAFILGFLIFSSLHITIGEQVPKTLAIRRAESVSLWIAYPLRFFYLAFYPLNITLNAASRGILMLLGVQASHNEIYNSDEIKELVSQSTEHGEIHEIKGKMLDNMFNFDLLQVRQVMIPFHKVTCLDVNSSADTNRDILKSSGHSRFPLIDSESKDELVGLVIAKDLYRAELSGEPDPIGNLQKFARKCLVITARQNIASLFERMRQQRTHFAFVVDEYGVLEGIVTLEDLIEEIVGEIEDETDERRASNIEPTGEGIWIVNGLTPLSEIEKQIGIKFSDELEINTVSGYIMEKLSRIPAAGDRISELGFQLTVKDVIRHRAKTVVLEIKSETSDQEST